MILFENEPLNASLLQNNWQLEASPCFGTQIPISTHGTRQTKPITAYSLEFELNLTPDGKKNVIITLCNNYALAALVTQLAHTLCFQLISIGESGKPNENESNVKPQV